MLKVIDSWLPHLVIDSYFILWSVKTKKISVWIVGRSGSSRQREMVGTSLLLAAAVCLLTARALFHDGFSVQLRHLSTVYLPHAPEGEGPDHDAPQYEFGVESVERAAYEPSGKMIYAVGGNALHIIDASDPTNLSRVDTSFNVSRRFKDVALCGGSLFVTYMDQDNPREGGVLQFQQYDKQQKLIRHVRSISIGTYSDKLRSTKSCTLVVALENPPVAVGDNVWYDPPGGVGIIRFPNGVTKEPTVDTLNFTAFDDRFQELARSGVRWVYRGDNNKFSDDLEPEYVTFNAEETKAYVCLQENNAIAVVDLQNSRVTDIYGLGFKNWAQSKLDPSDKDGGIRMAPWAVYGMYQPEGMEWFHWDGQDYIVTANEGDNKQFGEFREEWRGHDFSESDIADSVSGEMKSALQDDAKLGRLHISKIDGRNPQGKFEKFYMYGARSFSIWRASDMAQVYDSGSYLGEKVKELRDELFNNHIDGGNSTVASGRDQLSDYKGMEPETVAVAVLKGHLVIFVALEKPGSIAVYSVAPKEGMTPRFQSLYTNGIPNEPKTWGQMFQEESLHAVYPEFLSVIDKDSGLADYPILMVTGTVSGTVSLLKVDITDTSGSAISQGPVLSLLSSCLLLGTLLVLRQ